MKKIALVTGVSSNLGSDIVKELLKSGYCVYGGARKHNSNKFLSKNYYPVKLDITKKESIKSVYKKVNSKYGKLDVLVNVAGVNIRGVSLDTSLNEAKGLFAVNFFGPFAMTKHFLPLLKKADNAKVINISSLSGLASFPNYALYSASKYALEALGQGMRGELVREGVWVTNIVPGAIKSRHKVNLSFKPMRERYLILRILMPMVTTEEVALSVTAVVKKDKPPMELLLGNDTKIVNIIKRLLPSSWWDSLILHMWG